MRRDTACSALQTVNTSIMFLILLVLSILLSLKAVLLQREELCASLEGGDTGALPSPFPLQKASGGIAIGALGYFFVLALRAWDEAVEAGDPKEVCLTRVNLWASLFVLSAAILRFLALNARQDAAEAALDEELPA